MKRGGWLRRRTALRAKTGLRTKTGLRRKTPLKTKGRSRFPHRREPSFLAWIRRFPCFALGVHAGRVEAAHVKTRGAGGDDVGGTVPLCTGHHRLQHAIGIRTFEARCWAGGSMAATAAHLGVMWLTRQRAAA